MVLDTVKYCTYANRNVTYLTTQLSGGRWDCSRHRAEARQMERSCRYDAN